MGILNLDKYDTVEVPNISGGLKSKVFIAKDLSHYYIRSGGGYIENIEHNFIYEAANINGTKYAKATIVSSKIKRIKATKLAKKMYPDRVEKDGYITNYSNLRCKNE